MILFTKFRTGSLDHGSEDCGAHYGEDTELGHVRRELFAELGEVGASAAAAAAAAAASAASAAAPTETPPRPKRARKSLQRFDPVQAERGGGGGWPPYPKFSAPPAGPLQAAEATFPDKAWISTHLLGFRVGD